MNMEINLNTLLLGTINILLIVIGYFIRRYINSIDKRLEHLEQFGCIFCQVEHTKGKGE